MKNILSVILLSVLLVGCNSIGKVKYHDVATPVYVVPAPPKIERPTLAIDSLTEEQRNDPGLVEQAKRASSIQKQGYIEQLEAIIAKYGALAVESQTNLNKMLGANAPLVPSIDSASVDEWKVKMAPIPEKNQRP